MLLDELEKAQASNPSLTIPIAAGSAPAVKQAVRGIDSLDPNERLAAIRTLAQMDDRTAREALARALEHPVRAFQLSSALVCQLFQKPPP